MTLVRSSPSGPLENIESGDVESVFGRDGAVVAEFGDYGTDLLPNGSSVPGVTSTEVLDALLASVFIINDSSVSGATLPEALDNLFDGHPLGSGAFRDTFQGGRADAVTVPSGSAAIGDLGWGYAEFDGNGASVAPVAAIQGGIGLYRLASGNTAPGAGGSIYLGLVTGLISSGGWQSVTFRVRPNASGQDEIVQWGLTNDAAQSMFDGEAAGFSVEPFDSPNYHTFTVSAGSMTLVDTGVPIDSALHDFEMVLMDGPLIAFFIDGTLVSNHGENLPTGDLVPCVSALQGVFVCSVDIDDFLLIPAVA